MTSTAKASLCPVPNRVPDRDPGMPGMHPCVVQVVRAKNGSMMTGPATSAGVVELGDELKTIIIVANRSMIID